MDYSRMNKPSDLEGITKAPPFVWFFFIIFILAVIFVMSYLAGGWNYAVLIFGGLWAGRDFIIPFMSWFITFGVLCLTLAITIEKTLDKIAGNNSILCWLRNLVVGRLIFAALIASVVPAIAMTVLVHLGYEWVIMLTSLALLAISRLWKSMQKPKEPQANPKGVGEKDG